MAITLCSYDDAGAALQLGGPFRAMWRLVDCISWLLLGALERLAAMTALFSVAAFRI
jgi:hypothetical protein